MGCCYSTTKTSPQKPLHTSGDISKSPPQAEESVKEVLSESHIDPKSHHNHQFTKSASNDVVPFMAASENCNNSTAMRGNSGNPKKGEFQEFQRRLPARFNNLSFSGEVMGEKQHEKYPCRVGSEYGSKTDCGEISSRSETRFDRVGFGWDSKIGTVDEEKDGVGDTWPPTSNDCEKSLVSLECFIFL